MNRQKAVVMKRFTVGIGEMMSSLSILMGYELTCVRNYIFQNEEFNAALDDEEKWSLVCGVVRDLDDNDVSPRFIMKKFGVSMVGLTSAWKKVVQEVETFSELVRAEVHM